MKIIAKCPDCGNRHLLHQTAADRRMRCVSCGKIFRVPSLKEVPRALKIVTEAGCRVYVDSRGNTYG